MDPEFLNNLDKLSQSGILTLGDSSITTAQWDRQNNRPPLLCWGLELLMADFLVDLRTVYFSLKAREQEVGYTAVHQWLIYPPHQTHLKGESHFSATDLKEWKKKYPNSPGPITLRRGNPNKGVLPYKQ
jgi:hypothetical protein